MKSWDIFDSSDFIFAEFHFFQINKTIQFFDFGDKVVFEIQLFKKFARVDALNFSDEVWFQVDLPQIGEVLKTFHRWKFHMGKVETFDW